MTIGVGRLGAIVSPFIAGILFDSGLQKNQLYFVAALILLLAALAVFFLPKKSLTHPYYIDQTAKKKHNSTA